MTRDEFRTTIEEIVEAEPGSLADDTELETLENWDSVSVVTFISAADEHFGKQFAARQIGQCKSVGDLLDLVTA